MKKLILSFLAGAGLILGGMAYIANAAPITSVPGGGTGTSTLPTSGYLLIGNASSNGYVFISSSSLGSAGSVSSFNTQTGATVYSVTCVSGCSATTSTTSTALTITGGSVTFLANGAVFVTTSTIGFTAGANVTITTSTNGTYTIAASGSGGGGVATSSPAVGFAFFKDGNTITGTSTVVQSLSNNSSAGGIDFSAATGTAITGVLHSLALSQFTGNIVNTFNTQTGATTYVVNCTSGCSVTTSTTSTALTINFPSQVATTSINGTQSATFNIIGDNLGITSTVSGATTTFILINTGNWLGTWQGVNSTTFYLASNPSGYVTSTITIGTSTSAGVFNVTSSGNKTFTITIPPAHDSFYNPSTFVSTVNGAGGAITNIAVTNADNSFSSQTVNGNVTTTNETVSSTLTVFGTSTFKGNISSTITSALWLGNSSAIATAYAGSANPCSANQAPTTISALGALGGCTSTFLTSNQTITLTGAVTGSGATTIATTFTTSTLYGLFSAGTGISFNSSTGQITNTGVTSLSLNGGAAATGTVSLTNIAKTNADNAFSTGQTVTGNVTSTGFTDSSVTSSLVLAGSAGHHIAYAGSQCGGTDQVTGISATGTVACSSQGSGGGFTNANASSGIAVSTTTSLISIQNTGVLSENGNTGALTDITTFDGSTSSTINYNITTSGGATSSVASSGGNSTTTITVGAGAYLGIDASNRLTASTTLASSTLNLVISNPTTTAPAYTMATWDYQRAFTKIGCVDAVGTTTLQFWNTTAITTTTKNADIVAGTLACGTAGNSTTTFTSSTLLANYALVVNVTSTAGTPTQARIYLIGTKQ